MFKPTDTYYQRLASRMKSKSTKKSIESDLYNLSSVSVEPPKNTYDRGDMDPYLYTKSASQDPVPNLDPRTVCYTSEVRPTENVGAGNQILREREYQVTRQWA